MGILPHIPIHHNDTTNSKIINEIIGYFPSDPEMERKLLGIFVAYNPKL